jgi:hypothetical protein
LVILTRFLTNLVWCDHNQLFKQLLTTFFLEFLELFTPKFFAAIDPQSLEILPLEYFTDIDAGKRKGMDVIIVRVNLLGRPNAPASSRVSVVVNCEHQSSTQTNFHWRMFFYFAQLHRKYLQPVYPIALFSFDKPYRPEQDSYQVRVPGLQVMDFNFLTIQLNHLNWRDFLTQPNPVAAALMAKMETGQPIPRICSAGEWVEHISNGSLGRRFVRFHQRWRFRAMAGCLTKFVRVREAFALAKACLWQSRTQSPILMLRGYANEHHHDSAKPRLRQRILSPPSIDKTSISINSPKPDSHSERLRQRTSPRFGKADS